MHLCASPTRVTHGALLPIRCAGRQVEVFTERAEAIAWLNEGVPPGKALL